MKKLSILSGLTIGLVLLLFNLNVNAESKAKLKESLIGTWQKCDSSGTVITKGTVRYKVITPETFVVMEVNKDTRNFVGDFVGTYTVTSDGEYTESINYTMSCYSSYQNVKNTFKVEIKNDRLYVTGKNNQYNEIWTKVSD